MLHPRPRFYLISATGGVITNEERAAQVAETMGYRRVSRAEYQTHMRRVQAQDRVGLNPTKRLEQEQANERRI